MTNLLLMIAALVPGVIATRNIIIELKSPKTKTSRERVDHV